MNAASFVIALTQMAAGTRSGALPTLDTAAAWPAVVDLAVQHRVAPLVWQALARAPQETVPASVMAQLESWMWQSDAARLICEDALRSLLALLSAQDIDVIVLKGAALAHALYLRPELRPYHDIDIVCRPSDYPRLYHTLCSAGYSPAGALDVWARASSRGASYATQSFTTPSGTLDIEVHFDVLQLGLLERHHEGFWREARTVAYDGLEMRVLAPVHQLLHLTSHAHRHGYCRLIWLNDLDLFIRAQGAGCDWDRAMALARDEGIGAVVRHALATASGVLGTPRPPLPAPTIEERLLGACYRWLWPRASVIRLDRTEHRRLVWFRPETGDLRDVVYSLCLLGRRREKWQVLRRHGWGRSVL